METLKRSNRTTGTESTSQSTSSRLYTEPLAGLRYELINNFGTHVAKGILLRLGHRTGQVAANATKFVPKNRKNGLMSYKAVLSRRLRDLGIALSFEPLQKSRNGSKVSEGTALSGTANPCLEAVLHQGLCGSSSEPCCWITAGFITGFLADLAGQDLLCLETECLAAGGRQCRFEIRHSEAWGDAGKPTREALVDLHFIEHFSCGQDLGDCSIRSAVRSMSDPTIRGELEACMLEVERFGQQLQLEVERKQMELRKRDDFLANILRDSADAIITIGLDDCIISWNKGAESIYGYTEEEVLGKNIQMLVPQENVKSRELEFVRHKLEKEGVVRNYKAQRVTKSGRKIEVILTRTPIRNEAGEMVGSSAIVKDITQLKKIESQLSRAEQLASMGELAASLAHEIKNPLAGIKGAIEVLLDRCEGPKSHKEVLIDVMQEVKRIAKIVQDLLGYARPKAPHFTDINIREVFRRVALLFDRTIEQKKIHLEILVDPDADTIYADDNLFEQVMLNLVLNGLQALGENGTLVLSTRRTRAANGVELTVQDNGPGIPSENLGRIFQPFFTTKKDGTGLGLATSKRIITDHGGTLTVASVPGMGATFRIWLPSKQA